MILQKKSLKTCLKKIKHEDKDFSSHERDCENFEQNNESIAINILFSSYNLERENLELCSSEWLKSKKESMTSEGNCFQKALNDSLDYQIKGLKKIRREYQNLSHLLISITGKA